MDSARLPLSRKQLLEVVRKCYVKDDTWDRSMWFKDFLKRHKKYIKHKKTKGIEMVRVRSVEEEDLDAFLAAAQQLFDQHQFVPDLIINADESPVDAMRSQPSKRLTTSTNSRASVIQGENEKLRTILPFIAASGRVWMVVLIFICGKSEDDEAEREVPINTQLRKLRGSYRFFMLGQKKSLSTLLYGSKKRTSCLILFHLIKEEKVLLYLLSTDTLHT